MNYNEITTIALSYADRKDAEVINRIDDFIKVTEARINRDLEVGKQVARATLAVSPTQSYYGLPDDFNGLRDIQLNLGDEIRTMYYRTPEEMNDLVSNENAQTLEQVYYSIIANQLQIAPIQMTGTLEITYYRRVPNLNSNDDTNWLSQSDPDCYIFGILVEISAFTKDADALAVWDARFKEALATMLDLDARSRWSGTPMQMRSI